MITINLKKGGEKQRKKRVQNKRKDKEEGKTKKEKKKKKNFSIHQRNTDVGSSYLTGCPKV